MILVSGATGFLGSHLLVHLLKKEEKIRAIKRTDSRFELAANVFSFYGLSLDDPVNDIEWVEADLNDIYSLEDAFDKVDHVFHTAAKVSFLTSDKKEMMKTNVSGTANLVNIALEKKIRKFCHVSSIAAIGRGDIRKVIDEDVVWKASKRNSNYAVSKYEGEREVWRGIEEGLNAVIVNPSIILGPGEMTSGSARLIETVEKGLHFYTKGTNGFVDVRDVVQIMIRLMESDISSERFVVSAENLDYKTLFGIIAASLNTNPPKYQASDFLGNIAWRYEKIKSLFTGRKPLITEETARTASNRYLYSSEKLIKELNYNFIPVGQTIRETSWFYLDSQASSP